MGSGVVSRANHIQLKFNLSGRLQSQQCVPVANKTKLK